MSGGADSTAMLLALRDVAVGSAAEGLGFSLAAVHVHHGLRGAEADADEAFVRALCAELQVPLTVRSVDVPTRRVEEREGLEQAARTLRYGVFEELLAAGEADVVCTAHTADDQAETVLLKLLRGAWTDGLQGIAAELRLANGTVARPMLQVSRAEVERYLRERGQPWRDDTSNADTRLTRNRLRHDVMPLLREINPSLAETLGQTAELAAADERFWAAEVARVLPGLVQEGRPVRGGGRAVSTGVGERVFSIEIARLRAQPEALHGRVLRAVARQLGVRLSFDETARVLALAGLRTHPAVSGRPNTRLELRDGLRGERSVREVRLWRLPSP